LVGSLVFETSVKESLRKLEPLLFDFYLEAPDVPGFHVLRDLVEEVAQSAVGPNHIPDVIEQSVARTAALATAFRELVNTLSARIRDSRGAVGTSLWAAAVSRHAGRTFARIPPARMTSVRRGLGKALIAEDPIQLLRAVGGRIADCPEYLHELGITRRTLSGSVIADEEVNAAVKTLGVSAAVDVISRAANDAAFDILVRPLRYATITSPFEREFIHGRWAEVRSRDSLYHLLVESHEGREVLLGCEAPYVRPGWLFLTLTGMLKAKAKRRQAYGYAHLIKALATLSSSDIAGIARSARSMRLDGPLQLRSPRTIEYGLRDWLFGEARSNFDLRPIELLAIAHVLSVRLRTIRVESVPGLIGTAQEFERKDLVENRLIPFNRFQPLKDLIVTTLTKQRIEWREENYFPSPMYRKYIGDGARMNIRASSTQVLISGGTLVRWITVSDQGRDHKKKELSGRAAVLPLDWSQTKRKYVVRHDIGRLLLVVDGTFRDSDLRALARLGWDGIFYPDEMDKFAAAIV
jgi:hypothetical protein